MCKVSQGEGCRQVLLFERGGEWRKVVGMIAAGQAMGSGLFGMKAVYLSSLFPTLPNLPPSSPSSSTFLPSFHTFHTPHPTQPRHADSSATFPSMPHALHAPVSVQTHPWLSSPLLRFMTWNIVKTSYGLPQYITNGCWDPHAHGLQPLSCCLFIRKDRSLIPANIVSPDPCVNMSAIPGLKPRSTVLS